MVVVVLVASKLSKLWELCSKSSVLFIISLVVSLIVAYSRQALDPESSDLDVALELQLEGYNDKYVNPESREKNNKILLENMGPTHKVKLIKKRYPDLK